MAIDIEALKKAAQACERLLPAEVAWYTPHPEGRISLIPQKDREFIALASPAAILELIELAQIPAMLASSNALIRTDMASGPDVMATAMTELIKTGTACQKITMQDGEVEIVNIPEFLRKYPEQKP